MEEILGEGFTKRMFEDVELKEKLIGDLIYFVHKDDQEKTEADWADLGDFWRDRDKQKTVESCEIHLGRCGACWERFQNLIKRYKARPQRN